MRKLTLLAAVVVAAAFSATSNVSVAQSADPNASTTKFIGDAMNPYAATSAPAAPAKHMKHMKKKAKKM